jgi:DNA-binding transcriptional ArsR family regulator
MSTTARLTFLISLNYDAAMPRPRSDADVFRAIADPTRRALLDRLARGEHAVNRLAKRFDCSLPAVSQHLKVLRGAGLVREERRGRQRIYTADWKPLKRIYDWVDQYRRFWDKKLDALGEHLDRSK